MGSMKKVSEAERKKRSAKQMNKILQEETKKFIEEHRAIILKRAEARLKKMIEILE